MTEKEIRKFCKLIQAKEKEVIHPPKEDTKHNIWALQIINGQSALVRGR